MNNSICGAKCYECHLKEKCNGCASTNGCPFGKQCFIAKYISIGGMEEYSKFKSQIICEFNDLKIQGMPEIKDLYALNGEYVTLVKEDALVLLQEWIFFLYAHMRRMGLIRSF